VSPPVAHDVTWDISMDARDPQETYNPQRSLKLKAPQSGGIMRIVLVNILIVILFSASVVSFSHAGASCCDPGAECCATPNISGGKQRLLTPSTASDQIKLGTVKKPALQINPIPWSATINQIGSVRLAPASVSTGCCPGTNSTGGCCERGPKSTLLLSPNTSTVTEILAVKPFLGTLW
jgi:hypothetical protein